ncbi:TonB-dependent receptor [Rariglobus hedericola]|uniref:TonB-dependent receptor n=1 Tax=Rariglobus hedericola TaxID=2597822 RepID=A0A556QKL9_9BACT|nr:TonB-dependent receptor plug domain-containing protein [Rariglobus hedericola]TSJ77167.1 TonB-dependent receptor [Rariglobus hedericola]
MTSPWAFYRAGLRAPIRLFLCTGLVVLTLVSSVVLRADEDPVTLQSVEVTAQSAEASRLAVPGAVTAYDGSFLVANGINDYEQLAPLVPGFFATNQSVDNVSLNLRGLTSDSSDPRVQPRVSVFQDGIGLNNIHGNNVAWFDLDSVSVFKGPQPTRFGEGVETGAVSITSNRARNESSGHLTVGFGDFNTRLAEAAINRPVVADKLFIRVAVMVEERDGYVKNLADGSDLQGDGTVGFRTSLRWQPTAATTVDLILNYQHDDTSGTAFKSGVIGVPPAFIDTNPYTPANLNRGSELGIVRDVTGLTGIVRHEVNETWTLTSTSAWRQVDNRDEFDADGSFLYLLEVGERFDGQQLSQELRLDYDRGGRFTASTGVQVAWSRDDQEVLVRTNENLLNLFLGNPPAPGLNPRYMERHTHEAETTSGDVFGRVDYKLTDKLNVGGGLRVTQERIVSRYQSFAAPVPGNLVGGLPTSGGSNNFFQNTAGELTNSADEQSWAGQLDARYAFTPRFATYASVSRGRRPTVVDFNEMTLAPRQGAEESVWNYEVGIKGASAGRRIRYDASVFQYYFDHFQTQRVVSPGVIAPFDGGRARGQGFETTVAADVARELTLFAAYGFTDAKFSAQGENGQPQAFAGNSFRMTSEHVVSLGGTLSLPFVDKGTVFFTPLLMYRSAYYFEDDNAQNGGILRQGGFALVNLRVGYRSRTQRWEVVGYMNNVFEKQYLLDAGNIGGAYGIPTFIPAAPRTVGMKATMRF